MFDSLWQTLISRLSSWFLGWFSGYLLAQVLVLGLCLALALLLRRLMQRPLNRLLGRLAQTPLAQSLHGLDELAQEVDNCLLPLLLWVLEALLIQFSIQNGRLPTVLLWARPFFIIWFVYQSCVSLLRVRLGPEQSKVWNHHVLRPITLVAAVLHGIGLLDDLLALGIQFRDDRVTLGAILAGLAVGYLFLIASQSSRRYLQSNFLPQAGVEPALTQVLATFAAYAVLAIGVLAALNLMGISLTALAVIAGGLSVGIGFGLQEIVSNLISGFILLLERSIGPGDVVQEGETIGVVEEIGIRSMRIRTLDNVELIVPNARFLTETVTNYTRSESKVRVHIPVGVSYQSDPRQVEKVLLEAAQNPLVLNSPAPSVFFTGFDESSLNFELLVWTDDAFEIPRLTSDLRFQIWETLQANHIEIPFPQRDVHVRSMVGPAVSPPD